MQALDIALIYYNFLYQRTLELTHRLALINCMRRIHHLTLSLHFFTIFYTSQNQLFNPLPAHPEARRHFPQQNFIIFPYPTKPEVLLVRLRPPPFGFSQFMLHASHVLVDILNEV